MQASHGHGPRVCTGHRGLKLQLMLAQGYYVEKIRVQSNTLRQDICSRRKTTKARNVFLNGIWKCATYPPSYELYHACLCFSEWLVTAQRKERQKESKRRKYKMKETNTKGREERRGGSWVPIIQHQSIRQGFAPYLSVYE